MVVDAGLPAATEGVGLWAFGQIVIFPIAIVTMPLGALLRMLVGLVFGATHLVALTTGTVVGAFCLAAVRFGTTPCAELFLWIMLGVAAGLIAGETWWRIERPDRTGGQI